MLYCILLCCIVSYAVVVYCIILYRVISHCGALHYIVWYSMVHCIISYPHMSYCIVLSCIVWCFTVPVFYISSERNHCEFADRARWRPRCCSLPVPQTSCSTQRARSAGPRPRGLFPPRCLTMLPLKGNQGETREGQTSRLSGANTARFSVGKKKMVDFQDCDL